MYIDGLYLILKWYRFCTRPIMNTCVTNLDQLREYDVSQEAAFVPELVTASSLPPLFTPIEALVSDPSLAESITSAKLRGKVQELPRYHQDDFVNLTVAEKRRMLVILTFVAHGYVWGNGDVKSRLPETIAVPLCHLSEELGIVPLGTYATTVLWNSRMKDRAQGWVLENVLIDFTFTGTDDEALFYKVRYEASHFIVAIKPRLTLVFQVFVLKLLEQEH
jgi:indoleamine 2,3-dioxygenase